MRLLISLPLESRPHVERHVLDLFAYPRLCVRAHPLLEEVVLVLQRNALHEIKGVRCTVDLGVAQLQTQTIRHELNVLRHQLCIHPNQLTRQRLRDEFLLNLHRLPNDLVRLLLRQTIHQLSVESTGEIRVKPLVARNELVRERQARHHAPLLQPEDGTEGP